MIVALAPSYWQQILAGLAVIVPTLAIGAVLASWLSRSVLVPRARGRRWPEGARGVRPLVELVVDAQRRPAPLDDHAHSQDRHEWAQCVRFGLVVATCSVIPVSTGGVLTQPGLGLYVLALGLIVDATIGAFATGGSEMGRLRLWVRIGLAMVLAATAGVVHAQWGTASVVGVVTAQANASIGATDVWGLPTFVVHPVVCAVGVLGGFMTIQMMAAEPAHRAGALPGLLAAIVDHAWIVGVSAWFVAAFAGGGAVPWTIDNPGTRQVVSVVLFATKTALVAFGFVWAKATWSGLMLRTVRLTLAIGAIVCGIALGGTLVIRHLV